MLQTTISQLAATEAGAEEAEGIAALGIDPLAILFQAGTFLVLFLIVRKYALSKIVDNLEDRRVTIQEGLDNAILADQKLEASEATAQEQLAKARAEADDVIAKSHEEAGAIVADAQTRAQSQADTIVAKAEAQIASDKQSMRSELKSELLGLVAQATETVIDEKVDTKKDNALINRALEKSKA